MHTCRESRKIGMKFYKEFSYYADCLDLNNTTVWRKTFVNFETDIVLFESPETVRRFISSGLPCYSANGLRRATYLLRHFKHLAVAASDAERVEFDNYEYWDQPSFEKLDNLYIIRRFTDGTSPTGSLTFADINDSEMQAVILKVEERIRRTAVARNDLRPVVKVVDAYRNNYVLKKFTKADRGITCGTES
ncbi:hypothetical protein DL98DRAFT_286713 [Cadophora sp. DSE1049]|nr:hypothetical protein DL98DRAFT_286713 [Cadophora sp. DSE1049]